MTPLGRFKRNWLQPLIFLGNNPISLIGAGLTTASALVLIGFWVVDAFGHGGPSNPYIGIIIDLCLPGLFVFGLLLVPIGVWFRRRRLRAVGQLPSVYPRIDLSDPVFRHAVDFVVIATFINFVIVGTASYRGVAYMDTSNFCGQACHVMAPEWAAYAVSSHAHVACTECHIASGIPGFIHAKVNGTKQLFQVMFDTYPRPIMAENKVPAARTTCLNCHNPEKYIGDRLLIKTSYGDDEKNSVTHSLVLLHIGGHDQLGHLSGIHGAHLSRIEYIATDANNQTIPWSARMNDDGSITEYLSSDAQGRPIRGEKHRMDCLDCHNRAAHSFDTPEDALNKAMAKGVPDARLPFVHKESLTLIKASYASQAEAASKITTGLEDFYRSQYPAVWSQQRAQIDQAAQILVSIYGKNVFPFMKVTWARIRTTSDIMRTLDAFAATMATTMRKMAKASRMTARFVTICSLSMKPIPNNWPT